jgi:SAM-dependent methyltransferase
MIDFGHVFNPVRSVRSLWLRANRRHVEHVYSRFPRQERSSCWCGSELQPLPGCPEFGVCAGCGCYVNRRPLRPEALRQVYSLDLYWRRRQQMRGLLPIETRGHHYRSHGRLDYWLSLTARYGPRHGRVAIEVGCAPGVVLAELTKRGYDCIGVEADHHVAKWVREKVGIPVREGIFPGPSLPQCDLFLAFDVAELSHNPLAFWKEAARLLWPGGVAIIQTVVETRDSGSLPQTRPDLFEPVEHLFLFTERSIRKLNELAGLQLVALEKAPEELGTICVHRKPKPPREG